MGDNTQKITPQKATAICKRNEVGLPAEGREVAVTVPEGRCSLLKEAKTYYLTRKVVEARPSTKGGGMDDVSPAPEPAPEPAPMFNAEEIAQDPIVQAAEASRLSYRPKRTSGAPTSCFKGGNVRRQTRALKNARRRRRAGRALSESDTRVLAAYSEYVRYERDPGDGI